MLKLLPYVFTCCLAAMPAQAEAPAEENAELGQRIYVQGNGVDGTSCIGCHQQNAEGESKAGFPRLAGLHPDYQIKQLHDYREGRRENPTVLPIVSALTSEEIVAVSRYAAGLQAPNNVVPPPAEIDRKLLEQGRQLAEQGNWERDIPACNACHGPGGKGVGADFPALAAQHPRYLIAQISAWKFGSRRNDPNGLMKAVADRLRDDEIIAVAAYYGSLNP
jgi:thiosulfate dehydrogenase